jgi:cytochrome c2
MIYKSLVSRVLLLFFFVLPAFSSQAQEAAAADIESGKTLFRNYCGACHNRDMKTNMTGPALGGTEDRWADYPREDLYAWIRNSQAMINDGHPKAVELWDQWKPNVMNSFPALTDQEMENILAYVNYVYLGLDKTTDGETEVAVAPTKPDNTPLLIGLVVILAILAIVLARILSSLSYMIQAKEGTAPARRKTLVELLTSKGVIAFVVFTLVVLGGYTTVNNAIMLGRQQGYQPEQPIKFSHATHAGLQQIDCQYCHDGARRSKQSVIPAANTCMNCHTAVKVGSQYGTAEITKIYASIGYDPISDTLIADYDQWKNEDIEALYKKWIADTYIQSDGAKPERVDQVVREQWEGIVAALTNPKTGDNKIQGPIEWVRIHNLPDHAYFNHAQHVAVGKLECQQCHGPVEQMETVYQFSPLSMGWCINCHRKTEVKFKDNEYYKTYARYHEEISKGEREKVTVEDIGGLECQKCHY